MPSTLHSSNSRLRAAVIRGLLQAAGLGHTYDPEHGRIRKRHRVDLPMLDRLNPTNAAFFRVALALGDDDESGPDLRSIIGLEPGHRATLLMAPLATQHPINCQFWLASLMSGYGLESGD